MSSKISDLIIKNNIKTLSIIGLAKNTGKTVTLNKVIEDFFLMQKKVAIMSYGRDGEKYDLLTKLKKPPVKIHPNTYFVTAEKAVNNIKLKFKFIKETNIQSTMGRVKIYKSLSEGEAQLVGVNRSSQLKEIKEILVDHIDYLIIDGALDRKSSALPILSDAVILTTGAVIGQNIDQVIIKTKYEVKKLLTDSLKNEKDLLVLKDNYNKKNNLIWTKDNNIFSYKPVLSNLFLKNNTDILKSNKINIKYILLQGAFTNTTANVLIDLGLEKLTVLVSDSTKIFLDQMVYNRLKKRNIKLKVLFKINLIAITINPFNPYGKDFIASDFYKKIKEEFDIEVFNVKS